LAAEYRESDDVAKDSDAHAGKCEIIRDLSLRFDRAIDVLDLGCGTGRYFHCAENVRSLVGVDPSEHMLRHARDPVAGGNRHVHLIRSTLHEIAFRPQTFDLVMCIGVLAFWCPLDKFVIRRVTQMLRPDGIFFSTLVEYQPRQVTVKRRLASVARPVLFGSARRYVEARLQDFTISASRARALGEEHFENVEITKWHSPTGRIDLHSVMSRPRLRG
jgi:SAM-dependent methyltransferase